MRGHTDIMAGFAFFNDGGRIVTCSWDKTLRIWDVQKGTLLGEPFQGHQDRVFSVAVSPDDKRIVSGGKDRTIIIWDVESKQKVFDPLVKHRDEVNSVCFSPDGKRAASGSDDYTVVVWDAVTGTVLTTIEGHRYFVFSVAFSPDGLKLASGSWDFAIRVWRADNAELLFEINAHHHYIRSVVWSPDGQQLVSASDDNTVKFWDTSTGQQIGQPCIGHTECIHSIAISSDGSFIATASNDRTVRLWSTDTHQQIEQTLEISDRVHCVAIPKNGTLLASDGPGYDVYLWSIADMPKLHHEHERHKEELESNQEADFHVLSTPSSEGLTRESHNTSAAYSLLMVPATSPETKIDRIRAGNKDEGNVEDIRSFDVSAISKSARLFLLIFKIHPAVYLLGHTTTSQISFTGSAPQYSFVQGVLDSQLYFPVEVALRDLTASITKVGNFPVARGGFGEVWKCIHQTDHGPTDVAVKALLVYASDHLCDSEGMEKKTKRLQREIKICARLKHPNILPVVGYTYGFGLLMAIVCPWAESGNLTTYVERENATLTVVRRFRIHVNYVLMVVSADRYHGRFKIPSHIHGDLTGPNVLIHGDGTACLTDFGLSLMYSEVMTTSAASWTSAFHGNFRWLAPELLGDSEDELPVRPSTHSDIYSFGGIMLHVLTGKIPYYYLSEAAVIQRLGAGIKPLRARYPPVSDKYWRFISICWSDALESRPSAEEIVEWIEDEYDSLGA
ncbi:WD40 repeat-like protein [Rhizopogon vinicolor AM-OR11-026]|uniref:WD40 repeat-like protein n=1 Tax=Rhizopogon vinicolor AM-OR11-026 TaxID=1314800 RepID=A0A1B7ND47_9AGAM|nr:WD40 repeat-like protein [Rhizopogon vinicolor AM-OR11-026]